MAEKIKHETKISKESGSLNEEQRKKDLQLQKTQTVTKSADNQRKLEENKKDAL